MPRLLFEKMGRSVWISHLDLMRVFQRAFKRAGLPLTHTQGFNPRPSVSIALPLSVGIESECELLDFDLDNTDDVSLDDIKERLNDKLIEGVRVLEVYRDGRKIRDLSHLRCQISLQYDKQVPTDAVSQILDLFSRSEVLVEKKTKSGIQEQNIIPMVRSITIAAAEHNVVMLDAVICCQNPTLNPVQLIHAVSKYLPDLAPYDSLCRRIEILDNDLKPFR